MNSEKIIGYLRERFSVRRAGWEVLTPALTLVVAAIAATIILLATGYSPVSAFQNMWSKGWELEQIIDMLNRATPLYLIAIGAAIGFRMNIFNIGVEGQYLLAALVSAHVGAQFSIWAPAHLGVIMLTAMVVGAAWVAIPAVLKVVRGVHEVISTLMMNVIGIAFVSAVLLRWWEVRDTVEARDDLPDWLVSTPNIQTREIPESGRMPDINNVLEVFTRDVERGTAGSPQKYLWGFLLVALAVGILYHIYVVRTRHGYDLRAGGVNPDASLVAGVDPKRMILFAMLMSGAVAGLAGLPEILGRDYAYSLSFTQMLGFNGLAVALIGQNHAVGAALGALLFGYLDTAGPILDASGDAPEEIIVVIKGAMIFTAIIVYAIVRRQQLADQARMASAALAKRAEETSKAAASEEISEEEQPQ